MKNRLPSLLIVEDDRATREGLARSLGENRNVIVASRIEEAISLLDSQSFDAIVTDLRILGKSGLKVVDKALTLARKPAVFVMTAYGSIDAAIESMKHGAVDFLTKPLDLEKLEILIQRAERRL